MKLLAGLALAMAALVGCHSDRVGDPPTDANADVDAGKVDAVLEDTKADTTLSDTIGESATEVASDAASDVDAAVASCTKLHGGAMVRIDALAGSYCIDTREVTIEEFNEFIIAPGTPFDAPSVCTAQKAKRPARIDDPTRQKLPQGEISWCYANAYCKWAGKRLCGTIGVPGGAPKGGDDLASEWTYACTNGILNSTFPYGPTYDATRCFTEQSSELSTEVPETHVGCHGMSGPYALIFDMSGNMAEFDDWYDVPDGGTSPATHFRGGASNEGGGLVDCHSREDFGFETIYANVGIRCCADP